jgi:hypothetical protein
LARSISRAKGIAAPRLVVIPHPLAGISRDEVQRKADNAIPEIVDRLKVSASNSENTDGD